MKCADSLLRFAALVIFASHIKKIQQKKRYFRRQIKKGDPSLSHQVSFILHAISMEFISCLN